MPKSYDLITIGECLVEYRTGDGVLTRSFAGDTFNTAFYASRLGLNVSYLTSIGRGVESDDILAILRKERIDTRSIIHRTTRENGSYLITTDRKGVPSFQFWRRGSASTTMLQSFSFQRLKRTVERAKVLLLSMIPVAVMKHRQKLLDVIRLISPETIVVLDLNYRASLWKSIAHYRNTILSFPQVDYIVYSDSDGFESPVQLQSLVRHSVVKRNGSDSTEIYSHDNYSLIPVEKVRNALDSTGAGDAFNAGFVYGLLREHSLKSSVQLGNICGSLVLGERGGRVESFDGKRAYHMFLRK